jgi:hypothetical protein
MLAYLISKFPGSSDASAECKSKIIDSARQPVPTLYEGALGGERVNLWRNEHCWNIAQSVCLLGGALSAVLGFISDSANTLKMAGCSYPG